MKNTAAVRGNALSIFLIIVMAVIVANLSVAPPARTAPKNTKALAGVAFVDAGRIFEGAAKSKTIKKKIEKIVNDSKREEQERIKTIETLKGEIDTLKRGSKERIKKENELIAASAVYQAFRARLKGKAARIQSSHMKKLIADLKAAVAKIAKQDGYTAVLTISSAAPVSSDVDVLRYHAESQSVVFHTPSRDITERVAKVLSIKLAKPAATSKDKHKSKTTKPD